MGSSLSADGLRGAQSDASQKDNAQSKSVARPRGMSFGRSRHSDAHGRWVVDLLRMYPEQFALKLVK